MHYEKIATAIVLAIGIAMIKLAVWEYMPIPLIVILVVTAVLILWGGFKLKEIKEMKKFNPETDIDDKLEEKDYDKDLYHFGKDDPED